MRVIFMHFNKMSPTHLDEISREVKGVNTKTIEAVRKELTPEERYEFREQLYDSNYQLHLQRSKRLQELMQTRNFDELHAGMEEFPDNYCLGQRRKGHPFFVPLSEVIPGYSRSNTLLVQKASQVLNEAGIPIKISVHEHNDKILRYYFVPYPVTEIAKSVIRESLF